MLDIGDQLIDEFNVADMLLNEHLLMKIVADAVGEFFKEEVFFGIHLVLRIDLEHAQNAALTEKRIHWVRA